MREYLQTWYDAWIVEHQNTNLLYARSGNEPRLDQVHFVRDRLSLLTWADVKYDDHEAEPARRDCKVTAMVIGEHKSKSVRLPVYSIERPDLGLQIVLRDNHYNWNVSVISERPVNADLRWFELDFRSDKERAEYHPRGHWGYCFFEGFPTEFMFGPWSMNASRFSTCIDSDYELYAFVRNLMLWIHK